MSTHILIVGAGKSSAYVIETLLKKAAQTDNDWQVTLADSDEATLQHKVRNYPDAHIKVLDINDDAARKNLVEQAAIVVSLMPPHLHILLAKDCLEFKKDLITSSYASAEMRALDAAAKAEGLMFMCEMGLDPGIDHMTASEIFDDLRSKKAIIHSFKSYCGGLIAPESDTNPWHYKFSWNPRNIINAGKDGAHYLQAGNAVHVSYNEIFAHNETIFCEGVGELAYYANRDSLSYIELYQLQEAKDFMRATLRHPDFSKAWNALIAMGLTDTVKEYNTHNKTYRLWLSEVLAYDNFGKSLEEFAWDKFGIADPVVKEMILWLDIFSNNAIPAAGSFTAGDILLDIVIEKWKLKDEDKDMVVMQHEIEYEIDGEKELLISSMLAVGENSEFSAMAKTVGMPMAILAEQLLNKQIEKPTGVLIPTMKDVYEPVLKGLHQYGIAFTDTVKKL